ncbi:MAG TPA: hypothetical protein VNI54_08620, partial [Thermoanaerobaculia bacterium]|nr:hypothetical protein [Thermoanaerobaculia bacterium]
MPTVRVAPYRQIASEIAARLATAREGCDALSPWTEEVIVPSRGMAEAIAKELLVRLPNGIAGLRLQSLEELARNILATRGETPHVATDAERRLAMRVAVRKFDEPLMSSRGIAAMLERSYRDVRDSGAVVRAKRGLRNVRRTELVLRAWGEYERMIASMAAVDPAELLSRAADDVSSVRPQLVAGFYDMTGVQRALLEALLRADLVGGVWVPTDMPFAQRFLSDLDPCGAAGFSPPSGSGGLKPAAPL